MRIRIWCPSLALAAALFASARAGTVQPLDLKSFTGPSPFETSKAEWTLPRGRQVLDGTPFQIDGVVLFYATNPVQTRTRAGISNITVSLTPQLRRFDRLHLLAAVDNTGKDHIPVATIRFLYSDSSDATAELRTGEQLRNWQGSWHKAERPLKDPSASIAWTAQHSSAAQADRYLRLYHVALTNPSPDKEVRAISIESARTQFGLMLAGLSIGPAQADPLPDTWPAPKNPFPDLRPRNGDPARGEGFVKTLAGRPISNAVVRVIGNRPFNSSDGNSDSDIASTGAAATSDGSGHFILPPLPDNQLYRLLVIADGYAAAFYRGADPKSDPVEIRLTPGAAAFGKGKYSVHGRVVGPNARPLASAMVEPEGVSNGRGTSWGGSQRFLQQVFTDTNGEFTLARDEQFTSVQVNIQAPGLAPLKTWLDITNASTTLELGIGAVVKGRVEKDGKPVVNRRVGIVGAERSSDVFAGNFNTTTDTNGCFIFKHIPPDTGWYVYGSMDSFKTLGALPATPMHTDGNGQTNDVGVLKVVPGLRLSGKFQVRHGGPAPENLRLMVGYPNAWDSQAAVVDADGRFAFEGLAAGQVTLYLQTSGWHFTGANRSQDTWNPNSLSGVLDHDKNDLLLEIDKGDAEYNSMNGQLPSQDWPQNRPLYGAENSGPVRLTIAGRVLDDQSGQPVPSFKIIPGYQPPMTFPRPQRSALDQLLSRNKPMIPWNERPCWIPGDAEIVTNGRFSFQFQQLSSTPIIRVEAPGYLPFESDPINTNASDFVVRLKHGQGPDGVVLLPDGRPAPGAHVFFAAQQEQLGLDARQIQPYASLSRNGTNGALEITSADGKFSFIARNEGSTIFVAHPAGWAEVSVEHGGNALKLALKPWAAVCGTLVDSNGVPMAGVELGITMQRDWQHGGNYVNYQAHSTTDAKGHFEFSDIPPRRIEIQRMIPSFAGGRRSGGWTWQMQTWLDVQPGITNDLGKVTYDTPPPYPLGERLKQRFGL